MKPNQAQLFQLAASGALSNLKALASEGFDLNKEGTITNDTTSAPISHDHLTLEAVEGTCVSRSVPLLLFSSPP